MKRSLIQMMKSFYVLLSCLISFCPIYGQNKMNDALIYVELDQKIGYINFDGEVIIPLEYEAVGGFSENLVAVNQGGVKEDYELKGGKWGFLNREGKVIIPLKYEDVQVFQESLVAVKQHGKYGFIDSRDQVIIDFQYEDVQGFQEGLAAVKKDGQWGFIDRKGNWIIPPSYHRVENFNQGFSVVFHLREVAEYEDDGEIYTEEYGAYGLMDKTGHVKLDTLY
ncbi:MAG: WG repeat-containing protein, partial [Bacteroidota bacterium]